MAVSSSSTPVGHADDLHSGHEAAQPAIISRAAFESSLAGIAARTADPAAGIFGPASVSWKISRELALFLGAGRASLLQLAHPWVATALEQHSNLLAHPIARFHNTFRVVFAMVFGSLGQALGAARHLRALHAGIRGQMTESVAAYPRGSHYQANQIAALRWVYATLVESAVIAHECAVGPLASAGREAYYAESKTLAGLFGLPAAELPADWSAFAAYNREMIASKLLGVSEAARSMAHDLLTGAGSWIRPPRWYRALTAAWLPERFRDEFRLNFGVSEQQAAARTLQRIPAIYRRLPDAIRFVGPYREAQARLAVRRAGVVTRLSNRFWIGEQKLPFGDPREDR
jgi:uncharacterized protein (DUF2236 family)